MKAINQNSSIVKWYGSTLTGYHGIAEGCLSMVLPGQHPVFPLQ